MGKGGGSTCLPNLLEVVRDAIVSVSADLGIYDQVGNEPDRVDRAMGPDGGFGVFISGSSDLDLMRLCITAK